MSSTQLMVPAWEKDMVYLVQFPRMGNVPSLSPFALKAETWLRMAKVPYKNVNNNLKRMSSKGQIPFVEVNGREIADSNHIMDELKKLFDLDIDKNLSDRDGADMMAYHSLIEDTLRWQDWYFRTKDARYILEADGQPQWNFVTGLFVKYWMMPRFMKEYQGRCVAQGVGRETPEEVTEGAKRNLKAVSNFIGEKHYILGDKPTSVRLFPVFKYLV
ncbi:outer mitochondrial membrane transport complex protein domain-containing protein [Ditylenchus destructor]|uniref:Outer mitochondrial membrane transport complex protein domain-containing protein n=1 Tax=Ditylenchus destructor TaxID=166010 RepID=A0AAD4MRP1_9BILA|nr:outer mitochondrial membrane transport complex protein domain-containing protein [Ditylenchus destructor]